MKITESGGSGGILRRKQEIPEKIHKKAKSFGEK
jgi:hypothetical protein